MDSHTEHPPGFHETICKWMHENLPYPNVVCAYNDSCTQGIDSFYTHTHILKGTMYGGENNLQPALYKPR